MLNVTCGPMFAGKSTALYNDIFGIPPSQRIIFKPNTDTRKEDKIYIHSGSYIQAITLDAFDGSMIPYVSEDIKHIFIDEIQFFHGWMFREILLLEESLNIHVYGLDLNSNRYPWPIVQDLMCYADTVTKLKSKCSICGNSAKYTSKLIDDGKIISIGEQSKYEPRCETHYVK
jgi:thymidine kinase